MPTDQHNPQSKRDESITWFVRLSDDQPKKVVVIALSAVSVGVVGLFVFRQPVLAALGVLMVGGATADFWLGTHYRLDAKTASAKCGLSLTSMEWENVRRVVVDGDLIRVSPLQNQTRLEAFRGVLLRTLPEGREHVLEFVRAHCKEDVRILGTGASGCGGREVDRESGQRDTPPETGDSSHLRD